MGRRAASAVVAVACTVLGGCAFELRELQAELPATAQSSVILAGDGTPIVTLHAEENRTNLTLDEIPTHVQDAVIAIEDERFWLHNGVDIRAILRALRANAEEGGIAQGGSTITQQLVKQLLVGSDQTLDRKIQEAALAIQFEDRYTKERILELYLNTIYFGNGAYGLSAASHEYFAKPPSALTVAEGALLAGLIQAPNAHDPYDEPEEAIERRDVVLAAMLGQDLIDQPTHDAAVIEPLTLAPSVPPLEERYAAAHFVEEVKQWILDDPRFGASDHERRDLLFAGGLRVHTTIDLRLQAAAEAAVAAVLPDPAGPEVALVSIEPHSGHVVAMVGGRDYFGPAEQAKFNLAMGRGRHTGSSFKPIVLAAALQDGMPLSEPFVAPGSIQLQCPNGTTWDVDNYGEGGPGVPVDLVEATVRSYNTVYAQLILRVGTERAVDVAEAMGVTTPLDAVCAAVLGANDVQPLEMASVYATLANRGVHVAPVFVTSVERADGTIVYESEHHQERALDTDVADRVTAVLQAAVDHGTGTAARLDRPVAGKTGTAQGWRNAWFCGYVPQLATAVWVGYPGQVQFGMVPPRTPIRVTGGSYPAQVWQRYMTAALEGVEPLAFAEPPPTTATTAVPGVINVPTTGAPQTVPDVVGEQAEDATATLRAQGFRVAVVAGRRAGTPGQVVAMAPAAGTSLGTGGQVTLEVVPQPDEATVPDVAGLAEADAVAALEAAGLEADIRRVPNPDGATAPGTAWLQEPAPGTTVPRGRRVQVAIEP